MQVKIKKLKSDAVIPTYATPGSAAFDITAIAKTAHVSTKGDVFSTFSTGLAFEVPENHALFVFSRSGHGINEGFRLSNCVGLIDSDYRGEVKVQIMSDRGGDMSKLDVGTRVAQGVVLPVEQVQFLLTDELSDTARGEGGFGSTDHTT